MRAAAHFIVDVALLKTKNDAALHESIMGTYFGSDARVERDLPCDLRRVPRPSTADATLYKAHVQDAALLGLEGRLARPSKAPSFRRETSIISRYRRGVLATSRWTPSTRRERRVAPPRVACRRPRARSRRRRRRRTHRKTAQGQASDNERRLVDRQELTTPRPIQHHRGPRARVLRESSFTLLFVYVPGPP